MSLQSDKLHPSASAAQSSQKSSAERVPSVVALVATFNRPKEIDRLLDSLSAHRHLLVRVIIVDNAGANMLAQVLAKWGDWVSCKVPGSNLGCGGGLKYAYEEALQEVPQATHFLILDDDAVVAPKVLESLLFEMGKADADLATPLILGPDHQLGWTPGLHRRKTHRRAQRIRRYDDFLERFGTQPLPCLWACGICLLLTRRTMEESGPHRDDFWVRGEDIEFSLRHTKNRRGIVVTTQTVDHLPPPATGQVSNHAEYLKHAALLQNICYLTVRLPHGHQLLWTIPGTLKEFFQCWGFRGIWTACQAVWAGAVLGNPAGRGKGQTFFRRFCNASG